MVLYLLVSLLVLGGVKSQTANVTEELEGSRTLTKHNSSVNASSSVFKDETTLMEGELTNNQTVFFKEDDEDFQEQETQFPGSHCQRAALLNYIHTICGEFFHREMSSISTEHWCVLEEVIRPYNDLTLCLEKVCELVSCFFPNPDVQDLFVNIHSLYFHNCTEELKDAPEWLTLTLTLLPVSLIPVLVSLVVSKSKVRE